MLSHFILYQICYFDSAKAFHEVVLDSVKSLWINHKTEQGKERGAFLGIHILAKQRSCGQWPGMRETHISCTCSFKGYNNFSYIFTGFQCSGLHFIAWSLKKALYNFPVPINLQIDISAKWHSFEHAETTSISKTLYWEDFMNRT